MSFEVMALELNKTAAVFRSELSAVAIETYWESLSGYGAEDLHWAFKRARENCEYMPTIRDLLELLRPRRQRQLAEYKPEPYKREPWPERRKPGKTRNGGKRPRAEV
jgi:hypothetical protein